MGVGRPGCVGAPQNSRPTEGGPRFSARSNLKRLSIIEVSRVHLPRPFPAGLTTPSGGHQPRSMNIRLRGYRTLQTHESGSKQNYLARAGRGIKRAGRRPCVLTVCAVRLPNEARSHVLGPRTVWCKEFMMLVFVCLYRDEHHVSGPHASLCATVQTPVPGTDTRV